MFQDTGDRRAAESRQESLVHLAGIKPKPLVHMLTASPTELREQHLLSKMNNKDEIFVLTTEY